MASATGWPFISVLMVRTPDAAEPGSPPGARSAAPHPDPDRKPGLGRVRLAMPVAFHKCRFRQIHRSIPQDVEICFTYIRKCELCIRLADVVPVCILFRNQIIADIDRLSVQSTGYSGYEVDQLVVLKSRWYL